MNIKLLSTLTPWLCEVVGSLLSWAPHHLLSRVSVKYQHLGLKYSFMGNKSPASRPIRPNVVRYVLVTHTWALIPSGEPDCRANRNKPQTHLWRRCPDVFRWILGNAIFFSTEGSVLYELVKICTLGEVRTWQYCVRLFWRCRKYDWYSQKFGSKNEGVFDVYHLRPLLWAAPESCCLI